MSDAATITAVIVHPDARVETVDIVPDLEHLKAALGGGWLEAIRGNFDGTDWFGYCDEEGKIKGLPINHLATTLASSLGWYGAGEDYLSGPVVFVGTVDRHGDDTSVPADVLEFISAVVA